MPINVRHFIPLIGPFVYAGEKIRQEDRIDLVDMDIVSFEPFASNEAHLHKNRPSIPNIIIPEAKLSVDSYKHLPKADIITAVPPCAGLSLLNAKSRGCGNTHNNWMYESILCFLAQAPHGVLIMENAPALSSASGKPVVKSILDLVDHIMGPNNSFKMSLFKTSTEFHGIPQCRKRTFLIAYFGDKFKVMKSLKRNTPELEKFLTRSNVPDGVNYHSDRSCPFTREFLRLLKKSGLEDQIMDDMKVKGSTSCTSWPYLLKKIYAEGASVLDDYPNVKKSYDTTVSKKLAEGKGFWDSSPIYYRKKCNAVITKFDCRSVQPNAGDRFFTIREMMDLMGLPDDFELVDGPKAIRHIFQNVPVPTAADFLRYAVDIQSGVLDLVDSEVEASARVILQSDFARSFTSYEKF